MFKIFLSSLAEDRGGVALHMIATQSLICGPVTVDHQCR